MPEGNTFAKVMAKDKFHDLVRLALENDGWSITDDPYQVPMGGRKAYIDLGAERFIIGAEKGTIKIAVEIKTFSGASDLQDLDQATGQFIRYRLALKKQEPERKLYLAIPGVFYDRFFQEQFFTELFEETGVSLLIYDEFKPLVKKWIR